MTVEQIIMARPVKETPVLKGKDAKRFKEEIKENETRKVSASEYERAIATYQSVKLVRHG
jgi:hypothetical protein